jgi:hypothetical protein
MNDAEKIKYIAVEPIRTAPRIDVNQSKGRVRAIRNSRLKAFEKSCFSVSSFGGYYAGVPKIDLSLLHIDSGQTVGGSDLPQFVPRVSNLRKRLPFAGR